MQIKQVYTLLNDVVKETLGENAVVQEDLTGLVELGDTIANSIGYDKYVKSLVNHIGRVIFVNRKYQGSAPSVLMDGWEFGSICINCEIISESFNLIELRKYELNITVVPSNKFSL